MDEQIQYKSMGEQTQYVSLQTNFSDLNANLFFENNDNQTYRLGVQVTPSHKNLQIMLSDRDRSSEVSKLLINGYCIIDSLTFGSYILMLSHDKKKKWQYFFNINENGVSEYENNSQVDCVSKKDKKKTRVFLASSKELLEERNEISSFIRQENDRLFKEDIYLNLIVWEELSHSLRPKRIQDFFNEKIIESDIVIVLLYKKIGRFTKEEFNLAYKNLKLGNKPKYILIFFKIDTHKEFTDIIEFREEIERYEQLYNTFKNIDELLLKLHRQLRLIIDEIKKQNLIEKIDPKNQSKVRRIDAAVPEYARVKEKIDLIVQVRFTESPLLETSDFPTKQKPFFIERMSDTINIVFPTNKETNELSSAYLYIKVIESDCFKIEGSSGKRIEVPPDIYSKKILFYLIPMKEGTCRINIEVYTIDENVYLGTIPIETIFNQTSESSNKIVSQLFINVKVTDDYFDTNHKSELHNLSVKKQLIPKKNLKQSPQKTNYSKFIKILFIILSVIFIIILYFYSKNYNNNDTWTSCPLSVAISFNSDTCILKQHKEIISHALQKKLSYHLRFFFILRNSLLNEYLNEQGLLEATIAVADVMINFNCNDDNRKLKMLLYTVDKKIPIATEIFELSNVFSHKQLVNIVDRLIVIIEELFPIRGRVAGIKDNTIILNIGENMGVSIDQNFKLLGRNSNIILKIISVKKNSCQADILTGQITKIVKGEKVLEE